MVLHPTTIATVMLTVRVVLLHLAKTVCLDLNSLVVGDLAALDVAVVMDLHFEFKLFRKLVLH